MAEADAGMIELAGFSIDRFEFPNMKGALPTVGVSWEEAQELCRSRGQAALLRAGVGDRLPGAAKLPLRVRQRIRTTPLQRPVSS